MDSILFERDLVNKCLQNDRSAQSQMYHLYSKAMYNAAFRMVGDQGLAEDVLQEAFMDVFNKLHLFTFKSTLGAWIKRIVINACIDYLRKKKRFFQEIDESYTVIPEVHEEELSINVPIIMKAIDRLPSGYKMVFSLYSIEGYDHEEIGDILGISQETSKSQYHRAKNKLREIIKQSNMTIIEI